MGGLVSGRWSSLSSGRRGRWFQSVRSMDRWSGRLSVQWPGLSAILSVVWSVVRFVGRSMVQSVVRSVRLCLTRPGPYTIQWRAGFGCLEIGRASGLSLAADSRFRTVWCCGGVAVLRQGCRSVFPVDGPFGGPVGGPVRWSGSVVRSVVQSVVRFVVSLSRWSSLWSGPHGLRCGRNTSCSIQWLASDKCLDISRPNRLVFFLFPSSGQLGVPYY